MTVHCEADDVVAAKTGDHAAFERAVAPYRAELHRHCYRMTGSVDDADDLLQETLFRAWRSLGTYAGRSSFRAWLYRIATNRTIDALGGRSRREIATQWRHDEDGLEPMWLQPYHPETDPVAATERREDLAVAFIVAIQRLSPLQRAALLLRDVLGFSAAEAAGVLETSTAAVNSALQRARVNADRRSDLRPSNVAELALRDELIAAWHSDDTVRLTSLMAADITLTMPPVPRRIDTPGAIVRFVRAQAPQGRLDLTQLIPTVANRQPAFGLYTRNDADALERVAIMTIDVVGASIKHMTAYILPPTHFDRFGLPATPPLANNS